MRGYDVYTKHFELNTPFAVSMYGNLDENFIEKHWDELDRECIFRSQSLSVGFITRHYKEVNWRLLYRNDKCKHLQPFFKKEFDRVVRQFKSGLWDK